MLTLDHIYRYQQASTATPERVFVATTPSPENPIPFYFQGRLCAPRRSADLLLALTRVVGSRFHTPPSMLQRILRQADPVVTCGLDRLRWEGFSACAGVYARVDMLPEALDGALLAQGTTNVDFGAEMRAALTTLRDDVNCHLSVGLQQVELGQLIEKRVPLPLRWLKGFVECQAHQASMKFQWEVSATEARRFLSQLPRADTSGYVVSQGKGLRLSQIPGPVKVAGVQRLRILEDIVRHARWMRVYSNPSGASAWHLVTPDAHFHLVLSPELWRGFSGEGQVLEDLVPEVDPAVLAQLDWSRLLKLPAPALAVLASRGLVGYDLAEGGYFQRPLPYNYANLPQLHPRLTAARKLVENQAVTLEQNIAWVRGTQVVYRVVLGDEGCLCNCPWYAEHGNQRGPCKHILAAQMMVSQ